MAERKAETEMYLYDYLKNNKVFSKEWDTKKLIKNPNKYIDEILGKASKQGTGNRGEPDLLYCNEDKKLLILLENKNSINDHDNAIVEVKHYMSFFLKHNLTKEYIHLNNWSLIGVAFSGDISDEYKRGIDTFIINKNDEIENIEIKEFLDEEDYLSIFENIDLEEIASNISKSSQRISNLLRDIDSQKRPILLSGLMISLFDNNRNNDFKNTYKDFQISTIIPLILESIQTVLGESGVSNEKIGLLLSEIGFIKTDIHLKGTEIIKDILDELNDKVIPLFQMSRHYDIIGKFYEEFLKYAGVSNVKKGIVLTPHHITKLFTELIDIKFNDIIFDPCCGTGAFLISAMNELIKKIEKSDYHEKKEKINLVKEKQLLGFEKHTTMYLLSISNMLFRGDGKSQIHHIDFFTDVKKIEEIIQTIKPTIGFMNPPYGGEDNKDNPTKKEIQFLEKMLNSVSRYGIIIAPFSTYFKDKEIRNRILSKHSLKYVINMPLDLFQPNASTHTAIAVFETNLPHDNKEVVFYDLRDDGLILSKSKGRTDALNKWTEIKSDLLEKIKSPNLNQDNFTLLKKAIKNNEEWLIQAHSETDYSQLSQTNFENTIKEYAIYKTKKKLNLLEKNLKEIELFELFTIINENIVPVGKNKQDIKIIEWKAYKLKALFKIIGSKSIIAKDIANYRKGNYPYITTSAKNNGIQEFYDYWTEDGNVLTVDSATVGSCFFQKEKFSASDHVEKLIPKFVNMNTYVALFLATIINMEKFRYGYGRKFTQTRLSTTSIRIPVNLRKLRNGENVYVPDWQFMEDYIKSLPYSSNL